MENLLLFTVATLGIALSMYLHYAFWRRRRAERSRELVSSEHAVHAHAQFIERAGHQISGSNGRN